MIYLFLDWERVNSLEIERKYGYQAYESSPPKVQDSTRQSKLDLFVIKFVDLDLITFFSTLDQTLIRRLATSFQVNETKCTTYLLQCTTQLLCMRSLHRLTKYSF